MKYSIQRRRFVSDPPVQMSPTTIACVNEIRFNGTNEIGSDIDPNIAVATSAPGTQAMPAESRLLDRLRGASAFVTIPFASRLLMLTGPSVLSSALW